MKVDERWVRVIWGERAMFPTMNILKVVYASGKKQVTRVC
jgi:hypothetical protein